jgi:hypothetical protein
VAALMYLIGFAVAIFSAMFAMEKKVRWPYLIPFVYGACAEATLALAHGRPFDVFFALFIAISTLVLGWAQVRFQISKSK